MTTPDAPLPLPAPEGHAPGIAKTSAPIEMPAALRPWRRWLEWLSPEQILAAGDLLQRLQAALGAFRGPQQRGEHEPNGIDDLRRRGPYHRLLLSEWALADAAPDEFLRRASSGEHLFLSPRRETRKADARILAVFDTGPSQLGAPRLAQVALWILLARRAEEAGIEFRWGTTAEPGVLHAADSAHALKHFLAKRALTHAGTEAADGWRTALAADRRALSECWRIGAADDAAAKHAAADQAQAFTHRVDIRREWLGALAVRFAGPGGRREVALPLPPSGAAAKLLRGHFAFEVVTPPDSDAGTDKMSLRQPPLIGPGGQRIAVPLLEENVALIYTLPQRDAQAQMTATRSMRWANGRDLLCAALSQKHFAGIIADPDHLHFWQLEGFRTRPRPPNDEFQTPPGQAHWLSCVWLNSGRKPHHLYVLDHAGHLLRWRGNHGHHAAEPHERFDHDVLAIARADAERLIYLRCRPHAVELVLHHRLNDDGGQIVGHAPIARKPGRAFLKGNAHRHGWRGAWCMPDGGVEMSKGGAWSIFESHSGGDASAQRRVQVGANWRVCGLARMPDGHEHGLVALSPDRSRLALIAPSGQDTLYVSAEPISTVSVGSDCDVIALITERRRLITLSPGGQAPLHWDSDGEVVDAD